MGSSCGNAGSRADIGTVTCPTAGATPFTRITEESVIRITEAGVNRLIE